MATPQSTDELESACVAYSRCLDVFALICVLADSSRTICSSLLLVSMSWPLLQATAKTQATGVTALYTYDRLINLTREMDLVWRRPGQRRIPVVPILYGLMHVCTPVYFILNIATLWNLSCKVRSRSFVYWAC